MDRQEVDRLIAEHPGKPHRDAALEVEAWSKREPLRSVIAAYRRALADSPDTPAPPPEPEPPSASDTAAWDAAREQLRERLSDSHYAIWIEPLTLLGSDGDELVIGAPAALAGWVRDRFADLLDDALGQPWRIDSLARRDGERVAS